MPPTPDRTTVTDAVTELLSKLRTNLVSDPPTPAKPFRAAVAAAVGVEEFPRPFLSVAITRVRPVGVVDNDRIMEVSLTIRVVTDVMDTDPHAALFGAIGAVEDYLDSLIDTGVLEGVEGLDDPSWSMDFPRSTSGARVATATASQTMIVKVEREQNRVAAS